MSEQIVHAIFEMFEATRTPRSGWQRAGVRKGIENVAEHICLTTQIAFILAIMEKVESPEKVACMSLFHDSGEPRTGDQNKLNTRYFNKAEGEKKAFTDFTKNLPLKAQDLLLGYFDDFEEGRSVYAVIVKDADLLQMAFQGKYYKSIGYAFAQKFIEGAGKGLKTNSAKEIYRHLLETEFFEWCLA